jgi:hypothetical protein
MAGVVRLLYNSRTDEIGFGQGESFAFLVRFSR